MEMDSVDPEAGGGGPGVIGPVLPGRRGLPEPCGGDAAGRGRCEAERDGLRPTGRVLRCDLQESLGLVEVVEHQHDTGVAGEAQQLRWLHSGGHHDVLGRVPLVEHLGQLPVAPDVHPVTGASRGLDQAQGLVRLARDEDPQRHAVTGGRGLQLGGVAGQGRELVDVHRAAVLLDQCGAGSTIRQQLSHPWLETGAERGESGA